MDSAILRENLRYEPETGDFYWVKAKKGTAAGQKAGTNNAGYVRIYVNGKGYQAHTLAWLWVHGVMPGALDHINGNSMDNRIDNLRPCTQAQNLQNQRRARSDSTSGMLGVSWRKQLGKWRATITVNGKHKELGHFETKEQACAAYLIAKRQFHPFNTL